MRKWTTIFKCAALTSLALGLFGGCESTGGGDVSGSFYYGVGIYDPWYYGHYYYDDPDIIVTPPSRPEQPVRPTHPIAPTPTPRPMPSIPMAPRPSFRR
jgi:hypothetical protein